MLRRRQRPDPSPFDAVDPAALPPRWQAVVADALAARQRWRDLLAGVRPGPLQDRLAELGGRVDEGVLAVWETTVRAVDAGRIAETFDVDEVTSEYKRAKADPAADPALVEALSARFTSVQRVLNTIEDAEQRLRLLDARLGAAVARAAEVALTAGQGADSLGQELDAVVTELGALRESFDSLA